MTMQHISAPAGRVVAIALAFALAVALSDHLIARTTVELARAALASTEAGQ